MWSIAWVINEKDELDYKPQSSGQSRCVRWESLEGWAREKVAPKHWTLAEPDLNVLPKEKVNHKL